MLDVAAMSRFPDIERIKDLADGEVRLQEANEGVGRIPTNVVGNEFYLSRCNEKLAKGISLLKKPDSSRRLTRHVSEGL